MSFVDQVKANMDKPVFTKLTHLFVVRPALSAGDFQ